MKAWLAAAAALCSYPAFAGSLVLDASVAEPPAFALQQSTTLHPLQVNAVTADGACSVQIEFSRFEVIADDQDSSLSGRVKKAICGPRVIDSGFANGSYHLLEGGMAQIDSKIQVVLVVDE